MMKTVLGGKIRDARGKRIIMIKQFTGSPFHLFPELGKNDVIMAQISMIENRFFELVCGYPFQCNVRIMPALFPYGPT